MRTKSIGDRAEHLARQYLLQQGLQHISSQYRCQYGEIDLIMRDQGALVFIEVRYRQRSDYGSGADTIDQRKQTKLLTTANHYLSRHNQHKLPCRFDVISISGSLQQSRFDWIRDAIGI